MRTTIFKAAIAAAALTASASFALGQTAPDPHQHSQSATPGASPGGGDPMMQMMGGMMNMMQMMHGQGGMGGMAMPGMGMADRVEGRIAFLHAELKISAAQENDWARFADTIRANARGLKDLSAASMGATSGGVLLKLEGEEKRLRFRLDATRALLAALRPLYASFTEEQKTSAEELLLSHLGLMAPGMMSGAGMMGGAMMGQGMTGLPSGSMGAEGQHNSQ
jgi:hypothetical protein